MHLPVLYLASLLLARSVLSLDVSWIPSDPDGPLPQSTKYREALQRLCILIQEKKKLSPELEKKKTVITKLCQRLESDKGLLGTFRNPFTKTSLGLLIIIGGGAAIWAYREKFGFISDLFRKKRKINLLGAKDDFVDVKALEAIREARLKRFLATDDLKDD